MVCTANCACGQRGSARTHSRIVGETSQYTTTGGCRHRAIQGSASEQGPRYVPPNPLGMVGLEHLCRHGCYIRTSGRIQDTQRALLQAYTGVYEFHDHCPSMSVVSITQTNAYEYTVQDALGRQQRRREVITGQANTDEPQEYGNILGAIQWVAVVSQGDGRSCLCEALCRMSCQCTGAIALMAV